MLDTNKCSVLTLSETMFKGYDFGCLHQVGFRGTPIDKQDFKNSIHTHKSDSEPGHRFIVYLKVMLLADGSANPRQDCDAKILDYQGSKHHTLDDITGMNRLLQRWYRSLGINTLSDEAQDPSLLPPLSAAAIMLMSSTEDGGDVDLRTRAETVLFNSLPTAGVIAVINFVNDAKMTVETVVCSAYNIAPN